MKDYDLELDRVVAELVGSGAKNVGLQLPEGLKDQGIEIADHIESQTSINTIILADPTYGACDMKESICSLLDLDALVHFGHSPFQIK